MNETRIQNPGLTVEAIAEVIHAERCVNSGSCLSIAAALLASPALATLRAHERANALRDAADAIQALHPGEVKNSVIFLRDRADRQEPR